MNVTQDDYLTLVEVADELKLSIVGTRRLIKDGALAAYVPTPHSFSGTEGGYLAEPAAAIFEYFRARLARYYKEPLADYCLMTKAAWPRDERKVECSAIVVTDDEGKIPTLEEDSCVPHVSFGSAGDISCERPWVYDETEIWISKKEVQDYAANWKIQKKRENFLRKAYPEAVKIYEAILSAGVKVKSLDELKEIAQGTIKENRKEFAKILNKHLASDRLFEVFERGQDRRDFIGMLLKITCLDNGIKAKSYQDLFTEAKKLVK